MRLRAAAGLLLAFGFVTAAKAGDGGDVAAGEHIFRTVCHQCHAAKPYTGRIGDENLAKFLANPRRYKPTTGMTFPGLRNPKDIADVIAFITQGH